ncbi:MAG: hypothetical protein E6H48_12980 [Betaproteobacteria bacterium]|nr:MAG: hypothetical protein E6H48_12980 [Betaproteobacteria bacterium]
MGLRFLKIAVVYLVMGTLLGFTMGLTQKFVLVPVHAHVLLLGWASLALAGLVYHFYPAASTTRLAAVHGRAWILAYWNRIGVRVSPRLGRCRDRWPGAVRGERATQYQVAFVGGIVE